METLIVLFPLVISLGNCILSVCLNLRANRRIVILENTVSNLINTPRQLYQPVPMHYDQPPPPSAPPGYGYNYHSGDPNNQGLNIV